MKKPNSVVYEELKAGIAELINSSELPAFLVESILKVYYEEARAAARIKYQADLNEYLRSLDKGE